MGSYGSYWAAGGGVLHCQKHDRREFRVMPISQEPAELLQDNDPAQTRSVLPAEFSEAETLALYCASAIPGQQPKVSNIAIMRARKKWRCAWHRSGLLVCA